MTSQKEDITLSEAFDNYLNDVIIYQNQSSRTIEMHNLVKKRFVDFAGDIPVSELNFATIRGWRDQMASEHMKANTIRGYLVKVRVVVKYLNINGYKCINAETIGIPKRETVPVDCLDFDEVELLVRTAFMKSVGYSKFKRYRNRAMLALLFSSGLRVGELCSLNVCQIKPGENTFTIIGKGDKERLCFMDDQTHAFIDEYLALRDDNERALFVAENNKGARVHKGVVEMVVKNCARRAGLRSTIHPHTFRHSFATNLIKNNANVVSIKEMLGHENIQTTMTYTHIANEDLLRAYKQSHTALSAI